MSGQARSCYRPVNVQQQMVDGGGTKEEEENKQALQHNYASNCMLCGWAS